MKKIKRSYLTLWANKPSHATVPLNVSLLFQAPSWHSQPSPRRNSSATATLQVELYSIHCASVDLTLHAENFLGPDISKISADSLENRGKYREICFFMYSFSWHLNREQPYSRVKLYNLMYLYPIYQNCFRDTNLWHQGYRLPDWPQHMWTPQVKKGTFFIICRIELLKLYYNRIAPKSLML